jgi:uncharacterized protein (DUF305 family)
MTKRHLGAGTVLVALGLALIGCSGSRTVANSPSPARSSAAKPGGGHYPYTQADVDFMTHMIGHHAQALVMAGWAPSHGASPAVQRLADRIINGQRDEIATMQRWLRDRDLPVPDPNAPMKMEMKSGGTSSGHEMHHEMLMPGMLTPEQMKDLQQSHGQEFDRKFLTYMIQHHRGAVTMVNNLFGTPGAAQEETTFKMANDISADQTTEIARMDRMLRETAGGSPT